MIQEKASSEVEEIRLQMMLDDWVNHGGNQFSKASWMQIHQRNPQYMYEAILEYLDRHQTV